MDFFSVKIYNISCIIVEIKVILLKQNIALFICNEEVINKDCDNGLIISLV